MRRKRSSWYCISFTYDIDPVEDYDSIKNELLRIFGRKCCFMLPGDLMCAGSYDTYCDGYVFVLCKDIADYESDLRSSSVFFGCRDETGNVMVVPDDEIARMQLYFERVLRKRFAVGEMVRIKRGLFSNLFGIVTKTFKSDLYEVYFRLFCMEVQGVFRSQNLEFVRSVYISSSVQRVPLTRAPFVRCPLRR